MKKIIIFVIFFYLSLISISHVSAVSSDCVPPFETVEQAVICSGGTYGVIDSSNPDSANNFVNTVFDNGLTVVDGGGKCTSMNISSGIKFSCGLSINNDAYYYYEGKKGEKVTVTVSANNFIPEIDISDANGDMEFNVNEKSQNPFTITKVLSYTGKITFEVKISNRSYTSYSGGTEIKPFTISITSDKTNIQTDVRKDNLIEGHKYSVYELNQNQSKTNRKFLVDAYVINVYKDAPCSPEAYSCPISLAPNITIVDSCSVTKLPNACQGKKSDAVVWLGSYKEYSFNIGKQYQFEVSIYNTSETDIPNNRFSLVSVKNINGTDIVIQNPPVAVIQPPQKSIFSRVIDWFVNLFW